MKYQRGYAAGVAALVWLVIAVASIYGWVMNIVKLVGLLDGPINGWFIARIVGVFAAPLGVVLGYL